MPAESGNALAKFTIERNGDEYRINIEDDGGETMRLTATEEQLELLADTLDEVLEADDAGTVDADEDEDAEE